MAKPSNAKAGLESGIPKPGLKKGNAVLAKDNGNINISIAPTAAVNFTNSNAQQISNPSIGFA